MRLRFFFFVFCFPTLWFTDSSTLLSPLLRYLNEFYFIRVVPLLWHFDAAVLSNLGDLYFNSGNGAWWAQVWFPDPSNISHVNMFTCTSGACWVRTVFWDALNRKYGVIKSEQFYFLYIFYSLYGLIDLAQSNLSLYANDGHYIWWNTAYISYDHQILNPSPTCMHLNRQNNDTCHFSASNILIISKYSQIFPLYSCISCGILHWWHSVILSSKLPFSSRSWTKISSLNNQWEKQARDNIWGPDWHRSFNLHLAVFNGLKQILSWVEFHFFKNYEQLN